MIGKKFRTRHVSQCDKGPPCDLKTMCDTPQTEDVSKHSLVIPISNKMEKMHLSRFV